MNNWSGPSSSGGDPRTPPVVGWAAPSDEGLAVGGAYAAMQIGRSVYTVFALRGERLQRNFERILAWCMVSGALALAGGFADGRWRDHIEDFVANALQVDPAYDLVMVPGGAEPLVHRHGSKLS